MDNKDKSTSDTISLMEDFSAEVLSNVEVNNVFKCPLKMFTPSSMIVFS